MRQGSGDSYRRVVFAILTAILLVSPFARAQEPAPAVAPSSETPSQLTPEMQKMIADTASAAAKKALDEENCRAPEFSFAWINDRVVVMTVKADPSLLLAVLEIFHVSHNRVVVAKQPADRSERAYSVSFPSDGGNPVIGFKNLLATKEGAKVEINFSSTEDLKVLLEDNGWLAIRYTGDSTGSCPARKEGEFPLPAVERHTLSVDAGMVQVQQTGGDWKGRPELALVAKSRWQPWLTGLVDLRYSYIGAVDKPSAAGDAQKGKADTTPGSDASKLPPSPFQSGGGSLRANLAFAAQPWNSPSFAFLTGIGATTPPDRGTATAPVRYFAGFRFEVFAYNILHDSNSFGNSSGFIQFGYAHDRLWEWDETTANADGTTGATIHHDEKRRWFLETQLQFLDDPERVVTISPRLSVDIPVSGKGPSDIRVSLLAKLNVKNFQMLLSGGTGK